MKLPTTSFTRSLALLLAAAGPLSGAEAADPLAAAADPLLSRPAATPLNPDDGPQGEGALLPPPGAVQSEPAGARPSKSFSLNLLKRLVERGALTQKDAEELVLLADADVAAASAPAAAAAPPPAPSDVRVTYVPETVRNRIRDEVRDQLKTEAKTEGWYGGEKTASWADRVEPFADIRVRYEVDTYPIGNDNTGSFPNFNVINSGEPFDVSGTEFSPQYNVDQERQRARLRFRLGAEMDLDDAFSLGFRVGTGQDNSPVSSNQTLGRAGNGQGGNFSKYQLWLDRAFIAWEPNEQFKFTVGRFDNPFFSTTTMWSEDIGFDGLALQLHQKGRDGFRPYVTAGVFPVFNTDLNFATNQPAKFESIDKWLYGAQLGADVKLTKELNAKLGVAYYHFQNIEGQLSDPYTPLTKADAGNTDGTRPAFAQKGNTYRPLRDIVPSVINNFGTSQQYQYFGLATPFEVLTATGRINYDGWEPLRVALVGDYAKNLAFEGDAINAVATNNRGPNGADGALGVFEGSDTAWYVSLMVGDAALDKRGRWNAFSGYRYVGSDAVVDGFNDQDFGGGGTNVKGWTLGFNWALSPRVRVGAKWFSADEIAGPACSSDIIMFDLSAKF